MPGLPIQVDQAVDAHTTRAPTPVEGLVYRTISVFEGRRPGEAWPGMRLRGGRTQLKRGAGVGVEGGGGVWQRSRKQALCSYIKNQIRVESSDFMISRFCLYD